MKRCKLTVRAVAALPASPDHPTFYADTDLAGFGVMVSGSTRSYIIDGRPKGADHAIRITLGRADRITPARARELARIALGELAQGINANARSVRLDVKRERDERRAEVTLRKVFADYLAGRPLRPVTLRNYNDDIPHRWGPSIWQSPVAAGRLTWSR